VTSPIVKLILGALTLAAAAAWASAAPGTSARTLQLKGASRSYIVFAPKAKLSRPALVVVLHGRNGSGAAMLKRTRGTFNTLAQRDDFIVAYPDAPGGAWNTSHASATSGNDDVGYLSALIDALTTEFDVDPKRVYVTGFSMGASMSYRMACERQDRIAAIGPVAGGLARGLMAACAAAARRGIPLLVMHGTEDPITPSADGALEGNVQYWIRRNGCQPYAAVTHNLAGDIDDGTHTYAAGYSGCKDGADVQVWSIEGGGHHWPGGDEPMRPGNGREIRDFDAAVVIWDFFKRHPKE